MGKTPLRHAPFAIRHREASKDDPGICEKVTGVIDFR
jgi:hypothetical protein